MALYQSGAGLGALVGVGTTNPTSNLQVYGTPIAAGNVFSVLNTAASGNVAQFSSSAGTALIINANGNVGIGLTNPTSNLQVVGNVLSGNVISSVAMYGVLAGSNTVSASVVTASSMVGTYYGVLAGSNTVSSSNILVASGLPASIIQGSNVFVFSNAYGFANVMVMNSVGNVGIGTTNPTSNLQVVGNVLSGNVISSVAMYGVLAGANTVAASTVTATSLIGAISGSNTISGSNVLIASGLPASIVQGSNVFVFSNAYGFANVMVMNSVGNVGIGTPNPTSNLQVVGNVLSGNVISSVAMYGVLAGSNTVDASTVTASNVTASNVTASTVTASSMVGTFYGQVVGSNVISASTIQINSNTVIDNVRNISCAAITSSGGTLKTSYSQGTNPPDFGQAYFYNPTNAASQDVSCAVRIAGSSARNCYYSYDVAGVNGFSHGITGASQSLVFRASWDMSSATLFTMDRSGNFTATGNITANSDRRIKTDLQVIPNALEKVKRISGYTFKRTDVDLPRQAGVIAQELLEVLPEVVHKNDDGIYSVSYGNIIALLIEALKEESAKREELEKRLSR